MSIIWLYIGIKSGSMWSGGPAFLGVAECACCNMDSFQPEDSFQGNWPCWVIWSLTPHIGGSERVWGVRSSLFFSSVSQKHVKLQGRPTQPSTRPRLLWATYLQCQIALFGGRWEFWRGSLSRNQRWPLGFWSEQRWENKGNRAGSFLKRKTGSQLLSK